MRSPDRWRDERDPRERAERVVTWFADDGRGDPSRADHWGRGPRGYRRRTGAYLEEWRATGFRSTTIPTSTPRRSRSGSGTARSRSRARWDRAQRRRAEGHRRARAGRDHCVQQPAARPRDGSRPLSHAPSRRHQPLRPAERTVTALFDSLGRRAPGGRPPGRARHHACRRHPRPKAGSPRNGAGRRLRGLLTGLFVGLATATRSRRACGAAACCWP